MWPALILAASRKAKVKGRTEILIVSINTRKGFNHVGAPLGSNLAAKEEGENINAEIIRESQRGRARERVKSR